MKAIILGIDYSNFGSLAMLGVVKDNIDAEVFEFSHVDNCAGRVCNDNIFIARVRIYVRLLLLGRLFVSMLSEYERHILKIFKSADVIYDISGFALSSDFRWFSNIRYLLPLLLALVCRKRVVLLPQSFGPFDYPLWFRIRLLIQFVLRRVDRVFGRDQSSIDHLRSIGIDAELGHDIVFLYETATPIAELTLNPSERYVGIVPNSHLLDIYPYDTVIETYYQVIHHLVERGMGIVLFAHTNTRADKSDHAIITSIVRIAEQRQLGISQKIIHIDDSISVSNANWLYSHLEFIVSSRFHSLVLNYANSKPAIVIGWAQKYPRLAQEFGQGQYIIGADEFVEPHQLNKKIDNLIDNYDAEVAAIGRLALQKKQRCRALLDDVFVTATANRHQ